MIARTAWWGLVAVLMVVTAFAQLDRAARFSPELSAFVPAPFAGFAARHVATQALVAGDGPRAVAAAERLVRARPLPAEHLSLLAQAHTLADEGGPAIASLAEATRRGWRDPLAQQAAAQGALDQGLYEVAAQRVAAGLATGQLPEQTGAKLARLLDEPEGREAFARLLANEGRWQDNAPTQMMLNAAPGDVAATLARASELGARLPCETLRRIAQGLAEQGVEANVDPAGACPAG